MTAIEQGVGIFQITLGMSVVAVNGWRGDPGGIAVGLFLVVMGVITFRRATRR